MLRFAQNPRDRVAGFRLLQILPGIGPGLAKRVLDAMAANAVIEQASERFTKNLWTEKLSGELPQLVNVWDEAGQAHYVAERVLDNRECGMTLKQQAVLFRTSHHSGPLEVELTRRKHTVREVWRSQVS